MDIGLLKDGFISILEPLTLLLVIMGLVIGVFLGALPGIGSSMAIVLALPFTYFRYCTSDSTLSYNLCRFNLWWVNNSHII